MRDLISEINAETPDRLFAMAQSIVDKVEIGLIPDEQMEKTEQHDMNPVSWTLI